MSKKIPECMDRELPWKTALFAKATAGNTTFVKKSYYLMQTQRLLKVSFATTVFVLISFVESYACKCETPATVGEGYTRSDVIVSGKVLTIDTVFLYQTVSAEDAIEVRARLNDENRQFFEKLSILKVQFEITEVFKGSVTGSIIIYTPLMSATCGYRFKAAGRYIVYGSAANFLAGIIADGEGSKAYHTAGAFWTNTCTRTAGYDFREAEQLTILRDKNN